MMVVGQIIRPMSSLRLETQIALATRDDAVFVLLLRTFPLYFGIGLWANYKVQGKYERELISVLIVLV